MIRVGLRLGCALAVPMAAPVARAEVWEIAAGGQVREITRAAWRPAPPRDATARDGRTGDGSGPGDKVSSGGALALAARDSGLAPDLIRAVAWQESRFNPRARSPAGAMGIMQLMPGTARQLGVTDPYDPVQNMRAGAIWLRHELDRFDASLPLALAAYNAGEGAVVRHGGVPPYRETQAYVRAILSRLAARIPAESPAP